MAAGLGFKTFVTGEVLTAGDTNGYLMQGVLVFASAAARDAAVTSPQEGQFAYLKDTNVTTYYTGSAWTNLVTSTSGPAFKAFLAANSATLSSGVFTKVAFGGELFDTANCYDSTTNYRFTPTTAGYYQMSATAEFGGQTARTFITLYFNGARYSDLAVIDGGNGTTMTGSDLLYFNGSTDYAEVYVLANSASVVVQGQASPGYRTHFAGVWIRS